MRAPAPIKTRLTNPDDVIIEPRLSLARATVEIAESPSEISDAKNDEVTHDLIQQCSCVYC